MVSSKFWKERRNNDTVKIKVSLFYKFNGTLFISFPYVIIDFNQKLIRWLCILYFYIQVFKLLDCKLLKHLSSSNT